MCKYFVKIFCVILFASSFTMLTSCSQEIYTVTFETLGGSVIESVQVRHGSKIPNPSISYLEGYTFNGWNYNGERWDFQRGKVTSDMTLYAVWSANLYKISFDSDGGSYVEPIIEEYGNRVSLPRTTKDGFSFFGWEYNGKTVNVLDLPSSDITIKAVWDIDYKVWRVWKNTLLEYKGNYEKVYVPPYYLLDYNKVYIDTISNGCFCEKENLKEVIIQEGIKVIDNSAFINSPNLKIVTLPNTLESIGSFAFYMCDIEEIVIPSSVKEISGFAFYNQTSQITIYLEHETIPTEWGNDWYFGNVKVYCKNEWTYNEQRQPILV